MGIGASNTEGAARDLTVCGNVGFVNDMDGTEKTLTTATGLHTFNGHITVAADKNLHLSDTGTGGFVTGTGTICLNGDTTLEGGKSFTLGAFTSPIECTADNL